MRHWNPSWRQHPWQHKTWKNRNHFIDSRRIWFFYPARRKLKITVFWYLLSWYVANACGARQPVFRLAVTVDDQQIWTDLSGLLVPVRHWHAYSRTGLHACHGGQLTGPLYSTLYSTLWIYVSQQALSRIMRHLACHGGVEWSSGRVIWSIPA